MGERAGQDQRRLRRRDLAGREEACGDTVLAIGEEGERQTAECVGMWVHRLNSKGETKLTENRKLFTRRKENKAGSAARRRWTMDCFWTRATSLVNGLKAS